jgi:hypothetical protein
LAASSLAKENPSSKPRLSTVMSASTLRAKVEDYLKKSSTLESYWHRPITAEQLQAELDRMSRDSRDTQILRELYAALGNDAFTIAETLARQTLVERLIRSWYASDGRVHEATRSTIARSLDRSPSVADMSALGGSYRKITITRRRAEGDTPPDRLEVDDDAWSRTLDELASRFETRAEAIPLQRVSRLREDSEGWSIAAVLSLDANEMTVANVTWPKRSFDDWWSHERPLASTAVAASGSSFSITTPSDAGCDDDTWQLKLYAPSGRSGHTAVWTGSEMIVWGGVDGVDARATGGRYNPATNAWTPTSVDANAPSQRSGHRAVWTGAQMIVWGGYDGGTYVNTGARYDPAADSWAPTSVNAGVPSSRSGFTAVWTGSRMVIWGGDFGGVSVNSGRATTRPRMRGRRRPRAARRACAPATRPFGRAAR